MREAGGNLSFAMYVCAGSGWDGVSFLRSSPCGAACEIWDQRDIPCHRAPATETGESFSKEFIVRRPGAHQSAGRKWQAIAFASLDFVFVGVFFLHLE